MVLRERGPRQGLAAPVDRCSWEGTQEPRASTRKKLPVSAPGRAHRCLAQPPWLVSMRGLVGSSTVKRGPVPKTGDRPSDRSASGLFHSKKGSPAQGHLPPYRHSSHAPTLGVPRQYLHAESLARAIMAGLCGCYRAEPRLGSYLREGDCAAPRGLSRCSVTEHVPPRNNKNAPANHLSLGLQRHPALGRP